MDEAAVLLDRDGVLIKGPEDGAAHPLRRAEDVVPYPEAIGAIEVLRDAEVPMAIVSNQAEAGRSPAGIAVLRMTHEAMIAQLGGEPIRAYYCTHQASDDCSCRKPMPRNVMRALNALEAAPERSFMIGDWISDWRAARALRVLPLLVLTGRGRNCRDSFRIAMGHRLADLLTFPNVLDAVQFALDAMNHDLEKLLGLHRLR